MTGKWFLLLLICAFSQSLFCEVLPSQNQYISQLKQQIKNNENTAREVFRNKFENLVRAELLEWSKSTFKKDWKFTSPTLQKLAKQVDKMGDVTLLSDSSPAGSVNPDSPKRSSSGRIAIGWNLRSNLSKLEYTDDNMSMGLYHTRTLSALSGQEDFAQGLSFNLNKRWESENVTASFQMPCSLPYYRATITRDFSATVSSSVSAQAPIKGTSIARKFEIKVSFLF